MFRLCSEHVSCPISITFGGGGGGGDIPGHPPLCVTLLVLTNFSVRGLYMLTCMNNESGSKNERTMQNMNDFSVFLPVLVVNCSAHDLHIQ